jgi:hypothetical protein
MIAYAASHGRPESERLGAWAERLASRYRASSALRTTVNFGKGVLVGCAIVLLLWLMGA